MSMKQMVFYTMMLH